MKTKKVKRNIQKLLLTIIASILVLTGTFLYFKDLIFVNARDVKISNLTSTSATITWVTDKKTPGMLLMNEGSKFSNSMLDLFTSEKVYDQRDIHTKATRQAIDGKRRYTHYVTIADLKPNDKYTFKISNGIRIWDINDVDQNAEWYSVENMSDFSFNTQDLDNGNFSLPQTLSGDLLDQEASPYSDGIIFVKVYPVKSDGKIDEEKGSQIISSYVDKSGGWILDYSLATSTLESNLNEAYIFAHIENKSDIPGQFEKVAEGNTEVKLFKYDRMQSLKENFIPQFASKVQAAGRSMCCALIVSGRENVYFDYENDSTCDSCGACFPVGKPVAGGTIKEVGEVQVSGSNDSERRNSCESMTRLASEGLPSGSSSGGSGNFAGTCNASLKDSEFELKEIDRERFISYANRLAGDGSQAAECYNYVVCKARQNGINPAMMLNIWVHESAASNYKRFPGVEDMGIHCYGGAGNYPAYPCNQTPKEDIKAQTEMFGLLPHTKCLNGGFDIIKWSTGFWTGNCTDTSYGERYYTDLKLQWSSYGIGSFPNWMKNPSTAKPNLDCDTDGATSPESPTNGSGSGSSSGGSTSNPQPTTPTPTSDTPREMCCAVILEGQNKFMSKLTTAKSCASAFQVGTEVQIGTTTGKVQFGAEINYEKTSQVQPLCCAIKYEGRDNLYFDYENKGACNKCGECFPVGSSNGGAKVLAVGSEPVRGANDAEMRANCEATVRSASAGVPADTPRDSSGANNCNGGVYNIVCENGLPSPDGRKSSSQYGTNTRCINPNDIPKDDGIINVPITKENSTIFSQLATTIHAAEASKVKEVSGSIVKFTEDGIYNIQIGDYKVSNVPINSDARYRFFDDVNGARGFQSDKDKAVSPKDKNGIKAVKIESAYRLELNSGYNFISTNYKREPGSIVVSPNNPNDITSEALLNIGNIDEIRLTYITTYEGGKWVNGVKPREDRKVGIVGNSFIINKNQGYVIVSNSDLKGPLALILPGKSSNTKYKTTINPGWNFKGITGKIEPASAIKYISEAKSSNSLKKITITQWDSKKGFFESVQSLDSNIYGTDFTLKNGLGYFIYTDKEFSLK